MPSGSKNYDIAIIGAGIVGLATAMELSIANPKLSIVVIETEKRVAAHQTGNNSGVIHSGLYYRPGSLKAINCTRGRELMYQFCEKHDIPHDRCGKVVVALNQEEVSQMYRLLERGTANGLEGIKLLDRDGIKEYEPHINGVAGLFIPDTGIVNFSRVAEKYAEIFRENGGTLLLNSKVRKIMKVRSRHLLFTASGAVTCKNLINCGGIYADRIARMTGVDPGLRMIPFRGEYYEIKPSRQFLIKNLVYPVPNPKFPFLGVHFTRMIDGGIEAGPNAVLALKRNGYKKHNFSIRDNGELLFYNGFWKMASKHWRMGFGEMYRSFSKKAFTRALQQLLPEIEERDLVPGGAGVRAQGLEPSGKLTDDFFIKEAPHMLHVLNAPSPAATSSINIGKTITQMALKNFDLEKK